MKTVVEVLVRGSVGSGKSALINEIVVALRAIGVEANIVGTTDVSADHIEELEWFRENLSVKVRESLVTEKAIENAVSGAYEMPDGRQFWIDAPVAHEITCRVLEAGSGKPRP